jgi:hypothetical protein
LLRDVSELLNDVETKAKTVRNSEAASSRWSPTFIAEHRVRFGVASICRVLSALGCRIAPRTFYAWGKRPLSARAAGGMFAYTSMPGPTRRCIWARRCCCTGWCLDVLGVHVSALAATGPSSARHVLPSSPPTGK